MELIAAFSILNVATRADARAESYAAIRVGNEVDVREIA